MVRIVNDGETERSVELSVHDLDTEQPVFDTSVTLDPASGENDTASFDTGIEASGVYRLSVRQRDGPRVRTQWKLTDNCDAKRVVLDSESVEFEPIPQG